MAMDQVKLRCMLGQLGRSLGPYFQNKKFVLWRIGKNPKARVNQQVTKVFGKTYGTSETIREAASYFNFSDYEKNKPQHIKNIDPLFLTWFIGFFEGDGSLIPRYSTTKNKQPLLKINFEITQSIRNIKLLYWIRKKLGFGKITTFEKNGNSYARWSTSKRQHVFALLNLFNGNLIFPKRQQQFESIISQINFVWNSRFEIKPWSSQITLDNAWFAGFSDADAGFFTNIQNNFKGHRKSPDEFYYRLMTRFFITQDGDDSFLKTIQQLMGDDSKIYSISAGNKQTKKYNRLEITSVPGTEKLINYFVRFPLKGKRRICFLRWARVFGYKKRGLRLNASSASKLARLIYNLLPDDSPLENYSFITKHVLEYFPEDDM